MRQIRLNKELILSFEPFEKKIRLVVSTNTNELVCRKESLKKLKAFLQPEQNHIFKGRLQLDKQGEVIELLVKNKPAAFIATKDFEQILNQLQ